MAFFKEIEKPILKFTWNHQVPWMAKGILKKNKSGSIILPDYNAILVYLVFFVCALLCVSQIVFFTNWKLMVTLSISIGAIFQTTFAPFMPLSHFGNPHNIANFFVSIMFMWSVISDLRGYYCKWFGMPWPHPYCAANLVDKC